MAIATIYTASRKCHLPFVRPIRTQEQIRDWIRDHLIPENDVRVFDDGGSLLAMIALSTTREGGWIEQLYVAPDLTGKGIGSKLLLRAKKELDPPIFLHCFQENERARRFYEQHGFHPIELTDGSNNEEKCPDVLYRWERTPNRSAQEEGEASTSAYTRTPRSVETDPNV